MRPDATLVTGASRGIGFSLSKRLADHGHKVIGIARHCPNETFPGSFYEADLSDPDAARSCFADIIKHHEVLRLVNNAGASFPDCIEDVKLQDLHDSVNLNLVAPLLAVQACLPQMKAKAFGRIVNVSSRAILGKIARSSYAATKNGLVGFTRTWALELAGYGIAVNAVAPGPILTDLYRGSNPTSGSAKKRLTAGIPMGRFGQPREVAAPIEFLLSEEASYITGQVLYICGGISIASMASFGNIGSSGEIKDVQ